MRQASATLPRYPGHCPGGSNLSAAAVCPFRRFLWLRRSGRALFARSLPTPRFRAPAGAADDRESHS
jgi:hypothetical protein